MAYVMVLNDGETYTNVGGCVVVKIPDGFADDMESIEDFLTYNNSNNLDESKMFDEAIVMFFEERSNGGFRYTAYNKE